MVRIQQNKADKEKEEQQEEERKRNKAKFVLILPRGVPTMPLIIISAMATWCMDKGDYISLCYFTNVGPDNVAKAFSILEEDALSLVRRDDGLTLLVTALSSKKSRSIVEDNKLLWDNFCIVASHMILVMSWSKWPLERITMMMEFWMNINTHPHRSLRDPPNGSV